MIVDEKGHHSISFESDWLGLSGSLQRLIMNLWSIEDLVGCWISSHKLFTSHSGVSFLMYAISESSSIYHLLYPDQEYTLCGFRAERVSFQFHDKAVLHVVEFVPPSRELCKQCDKMDQRRKIASADQAVER